LPRFSAAVFLGMNPWDHAEIQDTVRFLAKAAAGVDRIYLNPPPGARGAVKNPRRLTEGLTWRAQNAAGIEVLTPPFGFTPVFLGLQDLAGAAAAAALKKILAERYGPGWRESTLVYASSWSYTQTGFLKALAPRHLFFHILDDSFAFPLIAGRPRVLAENRKFYAYAMAEAPAAAAVSGELAAKYGQLYRRTVHVLKNGVDTEHFGRAASAPPAPEVAGLPRPVLLYTGSVNSWVDLGLLIHLAESLPKASLVLVGHYYRGTADERLWQKLLARPNVHWLGVKPYARLPGFLAGADVLLLPRTKAEHSRASDPLKLYEYLASGKPVASIELPAAAEFGDFVYTAGGPHDFPAAVARALDSHSPLKAARQAKAMEAHSWRARWEELVRLARAAGA